MTTAASRPTPREECTPRDFDLAAAVPRGKPLVIGGLVRD